MSENPPGWYRDPAEPTTQRYWDGEGWLGDRLPVDATPPDGPLHSAPEVEPVTDSPTDQMPPGPYAIYPPGMLPPGAYPPGVFPPPPPGYGPPPAGYGPGTPPPPGMFPPGIYPPGAMPPGAMPPGMPPGAMPPGAVPPGAPTSGMPGRPDEARLNAPTHPGAMPHPFPYPYGPYVLDLPEPRPHGFELAPLGRRFCARLIDFGLVLFANVVLNGYLIYLFVKQLNTYLRAANAANANNEPYPSGGDLQTLFFVITLLAMLIWALYEVPSTGASGQTIGKRLMHLRVLPLEGDHQLGGRRALRRFLPMGLPMLAWGCGLGFVIQIADSLTPTFNRPLKLAMHDMYAATVVVSVPNAAQQPDVATHQEKSANGGRT